MVAPRLEGSCYTCPRRTHHKGTGSLKESPTEAGGSRSRSGRTCLELQWLSDPTLGRQMSSYQQKSYSLFFGEEQVRTFPLTLPQVGKRGTSPLVDGLRQEHERDFLLWDCWELGRKRTDWVDWGSQLEHPGGWHPPLNMADCNIDIRKVKMLTYTSTSEQLMFYHYFPIILQHSNLLY